MRKLVFILIAFIAVVTFIRAFDNSGDLKIKIPPVMYEDTVPDAAS
jgi:hypothetical protein